MNNTLTDLISFLIQLVKADPLIASGILLIFVILLYRKPKKTLSLLFLITIMFIVGIWFKSMFDNRNNAEKWKKYEDKRIEQIKNSGGEP